MNDEEKAMFEELFENALKTNKEEAVKLWNSALGDAYRERRWREISFWPLCEEHLKHAREKHPEFAKCVTDLPAPPPELGTRAMRKTLISRELKITGRETVEHVLREEIGEFLIELLRGDPSRACEEAADIVAVLLRALSGDIKKEMKE